MFWFFTLTAVFGAGACMLARRYKGRPLTGEETARAAALGAVLYGLLSAIVRALSITDT